MNVEVEYCDKWCYYKYNAALPPQESGADVCHPAISPGWTEQLYFINSIFLDSVLPLDCNR